MITFIKTFFAILVPMIIIDGVWLTFISKSFYASRIGHLFAPNVTWWAIILFYVMYATALAYFIVIPALGGALPWYTIFIRAALFGLVAYGTYDLTNQATLNNWPIIITIIDMLWGGVVTGVSGIIAWLILK
jgi:uncharacterized membrane protein